MLNLWTTLWSPLSKTYFKWSKTKCTWATGRLQVFHPRLVFKLIWCTQAPGCMQHFPFSLVSAPQSCFKSGLLDTEAVNAIVGTWNTPHLQHPQGCGFLQKKSFNVFSTALALCFLLEVPGWGRLSFCGNRALSWRYYCQEFRGWLLEFKLSLRCLQIFPSDRIYE